MLISTYQRGSNGQLQHFATAILSNLNPGPNSSNTSGCPRGNKIMVVFGMISLQKKNTREDRQTSPPEIGCNDPCRQLVSALDKGKPRN